MQVELLESAPHARALLTGGFKPSHAGLDLAYQEAQQVLDDLEVNPRVDNATIDRIWAELMRLAPGCNLTQRMTALRKMYQEADKWLS